MGIPMSSVEHSHFYSQSILCGLLAVLQLTVWQPHSLWRERWGLSHFGLKAGHVEWGLKEGRKSGVLWLDGVSWHGLQQQLMSATCTHPSCKMGSHMCIKACVLLQCRPVIWCWDVWPTRGIVQKALGKRNGFGGDTIAQQPPHSSLVIHNTVCHVTLCVFRSSEPWIEQCCSQEWLLCLWCQCVHVQSNCLGKHLPQCFHESALKVHVLVLVLLTAHHPQWVRFMVHTTSACLWMDQLVSLNTFCLTSVITAGCSMLYGFLISKWMFLHVYLEIS